jgi:hypothetical protein
MKQKDLQRFLQLYGKILLNTSFERHKARFKKLGIKEFPFDLLNATRFTTQFLQSGKAKNSSLLAMQCGKTFLRNKP